MPLPLMNHSALALFAQRTLLPAALASVSFGFVLVRVRVQKTDDTDGQTDRQTKFVATHF